APQMKIRNRPINDESSATCYSSLMRLVTCWRLRSWHYSKLSSDRLCLDSDKLPRKFSIWFGLGVVNLDFVLFCFLLLVMVGERSVNRGV
ncbi:hypothetical protein POUND7_014785, partial [Theobroma cacao]